MHQFVYNFKCVSVLRLLSWTLFKEGFSRYWYESKLFKKIFNWINFANYSYSENFYIHFILCIYLFIYFFACFRRSSQDNFFNPAGKVCRNNEWIKSTLMQIWKSANIFVLMWKQYVEGFALQHLLYVKSLFTNIQKN